MLTKISPNAIEMLKAIEKHFNEAFRAGKYSPLFRRQYTSIFNLNLAMDFSILGSNDVYIHGLGIIDCWEFDKNIRLIEEKVNKEISETEKRIRYLENMESFFEEEKSEGKIEKEYIDIFYDTLEEVKKKWEDTDEKHFALLPIFLKQLKGNLPLDYQIVKDELSRRIKWRKETESSSKLYQQLCDWIDSPSTKQQYGKRRWKSMKEKLALKEEMWFGVGGLKDLETAKRIISEVFYPDQEEYYKQLEEWANNEIEDKECSSWISSFLWTGRTIPVRQVHVLRYKGNIEKAKAYLLSKYEEKLGWDKKKQYRYKSLFDSFDENYNSFQEICRSFENRFSVFPICICSNVETKDYPKFSMYGDWIDGIKIQHDSIHYGLWVTNMTLSSTNRYFYTYRSKYKNSVKKIIIYSDEAFKLIKEYLTVVLPEISFHDNISGCITMIYYTTNLETIAITSLLSYSKDDYNTSPKTLAQFEKNKNCIATRGFQNTLGYRVFTNAAIFHIAKKIGHSIQLPLDKTISNAEYESLLEVIENKLVELSFEDRYLCHFIDEKKYGFPTDKKDIFSKYRLSRRINLFHNVQHHYSTPVFQEWLFPYGKIVYQYKNDEFNNNTQSVGGDFYHYKDGKNVWIEKDNKFFLFNLRTLCYLNWAFVCNETGNLKKLSALWLYRVLYTCYSDAFRKDKAFFSSLLYYTLIQNERIFVIIIDQLLKEGKDMESICKYDSSSIFYNIVRYYSNNFKGWGREMSYYQVDFLSGGKKKHELLNLFNKSRNNSVVNDALVLSFSSKVFDYITNLLTNDEHPHSEILSIFKDMKPFEIPSNFRYERRKSNNYIEYNGDYSGTYAHDVMGYSNDDIDTIFDGDPDAYWNID